MVTSSATLIAAALGAATGLRSLSGIAALTVSTGRSAHGRGAVVRLLARDSVRMAVRAGAVVEMVADKIAPLPPRTDALPFVGRVLLGAVAGVAAADLVGVGRLPPVLAGTLAAATTAVAGTRLRARAATVGAPDPVIALLEDACVGVLGVWATRRLGSPRSTR